MEKNIIELTKISDFKWKYLLEIAESYAIHQFCSKNKKEYHDLYFYDKDDTLKFGNIILNIEKSEISFFVLDKKTKESKRMTFWVKENGYLSGINFFINDIVKIDYLTNEQWKKITSFVENEVKDYKAPGGRRWDLLTKKETLKEDFFIEKNNNNIYITLEVSGDTHLGAFISCNCLYRFEMDKDMNLVA